MADQEIGEIRRIRHEISVHCHHDVHEFVACYHAYQEELKRSGKYRFVQPAKTDAAAPAMPDGQTRVSA